MVNISKLPEGFLSSDMPELRGLAELQKCNTINDVYNNEPDDNIKNVSDANKMVSAMVDTRRSICYTMFDRTSHTIIDNSAMTICKSLVKEIKEFESFFFPNNESEFNRTRHINNIAGFISYPCPNVNVCALDSYGSYLITEYNIKELAACAANSIICILKRENDNIYISDNIWDTTVEYISALYNSLGEIAWSYINSMYPGVVSYNNNIVHIPNVISPISYNNNNYPY